LGIETTILLFAKFKLIALSVRIVSSLNWRFRNVWSPSLQAGYEAQAEQVFLYFIYGPGVN
jgi:hypothetical protein